MKKVYNEIMDIGAAIILGILIIILIILLTAVVIIALYLMSISKEVKKIARSTSESTRNINEFSDLIRTISVPLAIISSLSGVVTKFNKAKRKRGEKNVKK